MFECKILPPATKLGQGYIFTGVCDSVHRGVSASVYAGIPGLGGLLQGGLLPGGTWSGGVCSGGAWSRGCLLGGCLSQCMVGYHPKQTPPKPAPSPPRADPQDQAPPSTEHAGRYGQCAGGTHPTGMQSCYKDLCVLELA